MSSSIASDLRDPAKHAAPDDPAAASAPAPAGVSAAAAAVNPAMVPPAMPTWPQRLEAFYARWRVILWMGLIAAYLGGFSTIWRPEPDAAMYLSTARNLVRGQGYTYQGEVNTLAWPGYPYLLAGLFKTTRVDDLAGAHVLSLMMSLAFLAMVYRLFLRHVGPGVAMIITGMTGLAQLVYDQAFQLRNDMPFALGAMAFLAGYEGLMQRANAPELRLGDLSALGRARGAQGAQVAQIQNPKSKIQNSLDWLLIIFGLLWAMAMRPNGWILLAVVAITALFYRSARWKVSGLLAVGVLAAAAFVYFDPRDGAVSALGSYEGHLQTILARPMDFVRGSIWPNARKLLEPTLVESTLGMEMLVGLNAVLGLAVVAWSFSYFRQRPLWTLWVLAMVGCLLIEPTGRYLLPVLPLLAYAWWRGAHWWMRRRWLSERWRSVLFAAALALWVAPNAWQVAYTMGKQRQIGWVQRLGRADPVPYKEICRQLRARGSVPPGTVVLTPRDRSRPFSYLLDRVALEPRDLDKKKIAPEALVVAVIPDAGEFRDDLMIAIHGQGWQVKELLACAAARGRPDWRAFRIVRPTIMYAGAQADAGRPRRTLSPSPGTPGEGWGEGLRFGISNLKLQIEDPHPNPSTSRKRDPAEYREREQSGPGGRP